MYINQITVYNNSYFPKISSCSAHVKNCIDDQSHIKPEYSWPHLEDSKNEWLWTFHPLFSHLARCQCLICSKCSVFIEGTLLPPSPPLGETASCWIHQDVPSVTALLVFFMPAFFMPCVVGNWTSAWLHTVTQWVLFYSILFYFMYVCMYAYVCMYCMYACMLHACMHSFIHLFLSHKPSLFNCRWWWLQAQHMHIQNHILSN